MRLLFCFGALAALSACGNNQSSEIVSLDQDFTQSLNAPNNTTDSDNAIYTLNAKKMTSLPPGDGKLTEEHLQIYMTVKVKEQLLLQDSLDLTDELPATIQRTAANPKQFLATKTLTPDVQSATDELAAQTLKYNLELYKWIRQTIVDTMTMISEVKHVNLPGEIEIAASNESVKHNIEFIMAHKADITLVNEYKLEISTADSDGLSSEINDADTMQSTQATN